MTVALGIDTGGTYTDAVLVDQSRSRLQRDALPADQSRSRLQRDALPADQSRSRLQRDTLQGGGIILAASKALTTRHDLFIGIGQAVTAALAASRQGGRAISPADVDLVGLSTTLATNAIVEGQGSPVCLLLIGYDPALVAQYGPDLEQVTRDVVYLAGGHDGEGNQVAPLDEAAVREAILARRDRVEAFAVSGYFGVRNPAHELRVRALVEELTASADRGNVPMPVTCGHELTTRLNAMRRAMTAALNARLIPLLRGLVAAVRRTLDELGIVAPLMIVKGDGSLVRAGWAMHRPIETILSGPAASVVGAAAIADQSDACRRTRSHGTMPIRSVHEQRYLAGRQDVWVVDVGGTTTDIAVLRDGRPRVNPEGARVGRWQTMVEAVDVYTVGLGGDSHVRSAQGMEHGWARVRRMDTDRGAGGDRSRSHESRPDGNLRPRLDGRLTEFRPDGNLESYPDGRLGLRSHQPVTRNPSLITRQSYPDGRLGLCSHGRPASNDGDLRIGPRRVVPLCLLASEHPGVVDELQRQVTWMEHHPSRLLRWAGEFVLDAALAAAFSKRPDIAAHTPTPPHTPTSWGHTPTLSEADRHLLQHLQAGPRSLHALAEEMGYGSLLVRQVEDLALRGLVQRSAFTPTDALHVLGRFERWNVEAARLGAELLAAQCGLAAVAFCEQVVAGVSNRVTAALVAKVLSDEVTSPDWEREPAAAALLARAIMDVSDSDLACQLTLRQPLIAVGAPVEAYLPLTARQLRTDLIIPPHAEVANAVGAVSGSVVQRLRVLIQPVDAAQVFRLHLPGRLYQADQSSQADGHCSNAGIRGVRDFGSVDEAVTFAQQVFPDQVRALAQQAGAEQVEVRMARIDRLAPVKDRPGEEIHVETELTFTAVGRPGTSWKL